MTSSPQRAGGLPMLVASFPQTTHMISTINEIEDLGRTHFMTPLRPLFVGMATLAVASAVAAHHSPAAFDPTKEIVIEGTITKVGWVNPHIYLTLAVAGPDGSTVEREVQAGSASGLTALGLKKSSLVVGERVTVRGFPNRRGAERVIWGLNLTTATGATHAIDFGGRTVAVSPTVEAKSLAGRWLPPLGAFQREIQTLRQDIQAKLTAAGRASLDDVDSYRASAAECVAWPAPQMMLVPMLRNLVIDDDVVKLSFDWMHAERVVHLKQTAHPADIEPGLQGHSIGRWDGATLVIDTVAFAPNRSGVSIGISSGTRKHLVERLSLAEDQRHLRYELTMEDPEYLTAPVSFTELWDHRPDLEPSGQECDPEIARRFLDVEDF
jgi:hypothetical protein